jgi:DNA-binding XRE family transcriptional regulator
MAEMCNVTRQSIYNFENNVGSENLDMLTKYGLVLDNDEIFETMSKSLYERKEINL